jgi:hypothetical protein
MIRNRALPGYKPEAGRPRIRLRGITRTEGSRGSLNDAISAVYVTQSLEPGWPDMINARRI